MSIYITIIVVTNTNKNNNYRNATDIYCSHPLPTDGLNAEDKSDGVYVYDQ